MMTASTFHALNEQLARSGQRVPDSSLPRVSLYWSQLFRTTAGPWPRAIAGRGFTWFRLEAHLVDDVMLLAVDGKPYGWAPVDRQALDSCSENPDLYRRVFTLFALEAAA